LSVERRHRSGRPPR